MIIISSIKKNFIYNSSYQILILFIPLITTPYISRVLGPEGTGRYSYAYSIAAYFVLFAMLGVNNYGNRSIAKVREDKKKLSKTFCSIFIFQLLTSLIMIVFYIIYIITFCDDSTLGWIMLLYVITSALDINWLFFGLELFKVTVVRNTFIKLITVLSIFIFVKTPKDVYLYSLIYVCGMLISQFILWCIVPKYIHIVKVGISDIKSHIKPNLILFIPIIAISLYKIMDKIMLGSMTSKTEVGYYEASEKIVTVPIALVNSLGTVMLPRMSNLASKKDSKKSLRYFHGSIIFAGFLSTSLSFGLMSIAKEFVPIFYGTNFEKCITLFQVLLPSGIFIAIANVIRTQYLIPYNHDKVYVVSVSLGAFVNLVLNLILIPRYKAAGAAMGTLFAEGIVCIYQILKVRKCIPIKKYLVELIPFFVSGFFMYIVLYNFHITGISIIYILILKIIIGILLYIIVLGILNIKYLVRICKNKV